MVKAGVLLVEDDPTLLSFLTALMKDMGLRVDTCGDCPSALQRLGQKTFDLLVSDVKLPGGSGMDILRRHHSENPQGQAILMTAFATIDIAVEAMKTGACDFLQKPFTAELAESAIRGALAKRELHRDLDALRREHAETGLLGLENGLREIGTLLDQIAASRSNVVISGESGTGKELAAREIHRRSPRRERRLVTLHVAAIPDTLIEAELFGHEKGAFTGAESRRIGLLELADGGTLFLDEIGDLSENIQVKILRFIQERNFRRLGGNDEVEVDVRIIAATNRDLSRLVREGRFREDLFFRLNVVPLRMPPLRDRRDDIPLLVEHFIRRACLESGTPIKRVGAQVMGAFLRYGWPGNVRELQNVVERAVALTPGDLMEKSFLEAEVALFPGEAPRLAGGETLPELLERIEREAIREALSAAKGVKSRAAELLGVKRTTLMEKISRYGIE